MHDAYPVSKSTDHLIGVPVDRLQAGMYVAELDRPWLQTPFLLEGMLLKDPQDFQTLQHYCRTVFVDPERSAPAVRGALRRPAPSPAPRPAAALTVGARSYPIARSVEQELRQAHHHYGEARQMVHRLLQNDQDWQRNIPRVRHTVSRFAESILANPSALNWLTRIKHENEYTAEHCLNVSVLAMIFARHLGLERQQIEEVGLAGMLHDVGKMKVDPAILDKPGRLTAAEFEHIKGHTLEGYALLADDPDLPAAVKEAPLDHHERLDGSGYPQGKRGEEIGVIARIIAIVDTYDAITSDRCYSKARPSAEALHILYEARGTQYDESLVVSFIECIGIYPPGSIVELGNGMVGAVLSADPEQRLHPRVLLMLDEHKAPLPQAVVELSSLGDTDRSAHGIQRVLPPGSYGIHMEALVDHLV